MKILDFPKLIQTYEYDCGAKVLQSVLSYYGVEILEEHLIIHAETCTNEGTFLYGILNTLDKYHQKYDSREMTIKELRGYIDMKIPVIILVQAWSHKKINYTNTDKNGHWVVTIGYNRNRIFFEDPYSFQTTFLTNDELMKRWHSQQGSNKLINHGIAVFGKKPSFNSKKIIHMD